LLLLMRAVRELMPVGVGEVRDRRLLENCTVDASIFVKHEACLQGVPGRVVVPSGAVVRGWVLWVCDRGFCNFVVELSF
jgi:hypothetical protein